MIGQLEHPAAETPIGTDEFEYELEDDSWFAELVASLSAEVHRAKYAPGQSRDSHGRFSHGRTGTGPVVATRLSNAIEDSGGFTYQPRTHRQPRTGMALSIYPEHERVIQGKATANDIRQYIKDKQELFADPQNHVGAWYDNGRTYLDVSRIVRTREEAHKLSVEHHQEAYYGLGKGETVYTPEWKQ